MSIQVKTTETASRELSYMIVPAMLMQSRRLRVAIPTHLTSSSMLIKILAIIYHNLENMHSYLTASRVSGRCWSKCLRVF